jgi:hypothetical protein
VNRIHLLTLCACLVLDGQASAEGPAPPQIDKITPASAAIGASVVITGKGLGSNQGNSTVTFGGVAAGKAKSWAEAKIVVRVPSTAKDGDVVVKVSNVASNPQPFKVTAKNSSAKPAGPAACTQGDPIPLGALSGTDADEVARTLNSIFRGELVVTSCATKSDDSGSQAAAPASPSADTSTNSKNTLQVRTVKGGTIPRCSPGNSSRCVLDGLATSLDRENYKGALNSNSVVYVRAFARALAAAFPHPTPDVDVEQADDGNKGKSSDYLVLVPSAAVLGQSAALKTLMQHTAGIRHDFELLAKYGPPYTPPAPQKSCPIDPNGAIATELCLADNTVVLSALNPRDVALHASALFQTHVMRPVRVFPLNHAVALLPPDYLENQGAVAVEQYELYQQNQQQTQLVASLQSTSSGASPAATTNSPSVTTTTTTIKTPLSPSAQPAAASNNAATATTSISTATSTATTPPAAGVSASGQGGVQVQAQPPEAHLVRRPEGEPLGRKHPLLRRSRQRHLGA